MQRLGDMPYAHLDAVLDSRSRYFIKHPAKTRLAVLHKLMETFDPMYSFLAARGQRMRSGIIPPSAFANGLDEWPAFEW
jgi:hypothetical protein